MLRNSLVLSLIWGLVAGTVSGAESVLTLSADIGPRPLAEALAAFGRQTGLQLIYVSTIAEGQQSKGARAGLMASEALAELLDGTGLRSEFLNARTVRIFPAPQVVPTAVAALAVSPHTTKRYVDSRAFALEEVVVTATRREEQASRVPIDMAVWTSDALGTSGVKDVSGLGALTPSLEYDYFPDFGAGIQTNIALRGVTSRNGTTTAIYLNDAPIPAPGDWGSTFGRAFPLTFDLERVEVLRGPQSTLFGQGAMGGAVRFITNQPSLVTSDAVAHSEYATTKYGDASYETGVAAGGPLVTNVLGFRVSGWYRAAGGYVDRVDPFTGAAVDAKANRDISKTLRGALTLAPTDTVRVTPSLLYQSSSVRDTSAFSVVKSELGSNPSAGIFRNPKQLREPVDDRFYLAALKVTATLGRAELAVASSYFHRAATATVDAISYDHGGWGNLSFPEYAFGAAVPTTLDLNQTAFAQELRLTSSDPNAALTWVAGMFYSHTHNREADRTLGDEYLSGQLIGTLDDFNAEVESDNQVAIFGHAVVKVSTRFAVNAGVRLARGQYDSTEYASANGNRSANLNLPPLVRLWHREDSVTPSFGLAYQADPHNLFYANVAKGYRPGGANWPFGNCDSSLRPALHADTLWSYEVGTKNNVFNDRWQFSTSLFYVNWKKQEGLIDAESTCRYIGNLTDVVSKGFDVDLQGLVTDHLKVGLAIAYTDSHHSETLALFPDGTDVIVHKGDAVGQLPAIEPPWSLRASIDYRVPLRKGVAASVHAEDVFHSRISGPFSPAELAAKQQLAPIPEPSTNLVNSRASLNWAHLDLALYVDNVLGSQPEQLIRTQRGFINPRFYATTFRPRTVGLSVNWRLQ